MKKSKKSKKSKKIKKKNRNQIKENHIYSIVINKLCLIYINIILIFI